MAATGDLLLRVESLCRTPLSSRVLRERLVALVRTRVAFEGHVFALTDPTTRIGTSPHADVPMLPWPRLPELIRWRYLTLVNRPDRLPHGTASSLLTATASPSESPMWQHVLRELGVVDTATVAFDDRYGAWGFLELWRTTVPFTRGELSLLSDMSSLVTAGLREAQRARSPRAVTRRVRSGRPSSSSGRTSTCCGRRRARRRRSCSCSRPTSRSRRSRRRPTTSAPR